MATEKGTIELQSYSKRTVYGLPVQEDQDNGLPVSMPSNIAKEKSDSKSRTIKILIAAIVVNYLLTITFGIIVVYFLTHVVTRDEISETLESFGLQGSGATIGYTGPPGPPGAAGAEGAQGEPGIQFIHYVITSSYNNNIIYACVYVPILLLLAMMTTYMCHSQHVLTLT